MNQFFTTISQAASGTTGQATAAGGALGLLTMIIPLALMVLIFWLLIIRPEKAFQTNASNAQQSSGS